MWTKVRRPSFDVAGYRFEIDLHRARAREREGGPGTGDMGGTLLEMLKSSFVGLALFVRC